MLHQTLSFILILASCAVTPSQTTRSKRSPAQTKPTSATVVGDFFHFRHEAGDTFGYSLELWREGDRIFGLLAVFTGAPFDPPTGLLEEVQFDRRTKQLSFSARLSTAFTHGVGNKLVPTHDKFVFKGVLTRTEVTGTLQQFDVLHPEIQRAPERVRLRLSGKYTEDFMSPYPSYTEWKTWVDDHILRRRGPQW